MKPIILYTLALLAGVGIASLIEFKTAEKQLLIEQSKELAEIDSLILDRRKKLNILNNTIIWRSLEKQDSLKYNKIQ